MYWFSLETGSTVTQRIHVVTQDIMEMSVNNGTSIVPSLEEHLEPKDNISGVCTDQPAHDNDVSVSEEEFY